MYQIGAPAFGIGVTVLAVIAASHGVSLIATVVLVSIYIFFMLGMTFYSALGSSLLVFASYFISAAAVGLPTSVQVIDGGVLIFTNVIGAMVCYTLERATRTNYLEERLLIETASRDGLTGIHNRRLFDEHVDRIWPQATRDHASLGLLLIDIDHFKAYNDYYGTKAGDECLRPGRVVPSRCSRRPLDIAARYGGEEFAIVLYEAIAATSRRRGASRQDRIAGDRARGLAGVDQAADGQYRCSVHRAEARPHALRFHPARRRSAVRREGARPQLRRDHGQGIRRAAEHRLLPQGTPLPPPRSTSPAAHNPGHSSFRSVHRELRWARTKWGMSPYAPPCPSVSAVSWSPTAARSPSA